MSKDQLKRRPPPRAIRHASPEEKAWLNNILQQLAYDEYMQDQRERWLFLRPPKRGVEQEGINPIP